MRVLTFSDLHGDQSLIDKIKLASKDCDLILCCGDITPFHGKTMNVARKIGSFDVKVLAIPGNFELPNEMKNVCQELGWINLHGRSAEISGLMFSGCGGGNVGPFHTPYELNEQQFKEILDKLDSSRSFVFISHCPPKGFLDEPRHGLHVGSDVIREFVEQKQPKLQFCGHIHESGGKETLMGNTRVINVAKQVKLLDIK